MNANPSLQVFFPKAGPPWALLEWTGTKKGLRGSLSLRILPN